MYSKWFIYLYDTSNALRVGAEGAYIVCNGVLTDKNLILVRTINNLKELRNIKTVLRWNAYIIAALPNRAKDTSSYRYLHSLNKLTKSIRKNFIMEDNNK